MVDKLILAAVVITISTTMSVGIIAAAPLETTLTAMGAALFWLMLCAAIIFAVSKQHDKRR